MGEHCCVEGQQEIKIYEKAGRVGDRTVALVMLALPRAVLKRINCVHIWSLLVCSHHSSFGALMEPINLSQFQGTYEDLIKQVRTVSGLVVVDFCAGWCPPCRRVGEKLRQVAKMSPAVTFLTVDIDKSWGLAEHYMIRSIPHFRFIRAGCHNQIEELATVIGDDVNEIIQKVRQFA